MRLYLIRFVLPLLKTPAVIFILCDVERYVWFCFQLRHAEERREEAEARARELEKQVNHSRCQLGIEKLVNAILSISSFEYSLLAVDTI